MTLGTEFDNVVLKSQNALVEAYIIDHIARNWSDDERIAFVESEECSILVETGTLCEASVVYLSKIDDLTRRTQMAAIALAKEAGDPMYERYKKHRDLWQEDLLKMSQKYAMSSAKVAKTAQKAFIKENPDKFRKKIKIS